MQEWREPSSALSNLTISPSPSASAAARPNAWTTPLALSSSSSSVPTSSSPATPAKSTSTSAKSKKLSDSRNDEADNATNQEKEDYLEAASRVMTQHVRESASSRAAAVVVPTQETVNAQRKDALLKGKFF